MIILLEINLFVYYVLFSKNIVTISVMFNVFKQKTLIHKQFQDF